MTMTVEDHVNEFSKLFKGRTISRIRLICGEKPPNVSSEIQIRFEDGTMLILNSKLRTSEYGISPEIEILMGRYNEGDGSESFTVKTCSIHDDYYDDDPYCKLCGSGIRYYDLITDRNLPIDGYRCENENCEMNYPHKSLEDVSDVSTEGN